MYKWALGTFLALSLVARSIAQSYFSADASANLIWHWRADGTLINTIAPGLAQFPTWATYIGGGKLVESDGSAQKLLLVDVATGNQLDAMSLPFQPGSVSRSTNSLLLAWSRDSQVGGLYSWGNTTAVATFAAPSGTSFVGLSFVPGLGAFGVDANSGKIYRWSESGGFPVYSSGSAPNSGFLASEPEMFDDGYFYVNVRNGSNISAATPVRFAPSLTPSFDPSFLGSTAGFRYGFGLGPKDGNEFFGILNDPNFGGNYIGRFDASTGNLMFGQEFRFGQGVFGPRNISRETEPVPEPCSILVVGLGALGLLLRGRMRRH